MMIPLIIPILWNAVGASVGVLLVAVVVAKKANK